MENIFEERGRGKIINPWWFHAKNPMQKKLIKKIQSSNSKAEFTDISIWEVNKPL